MDGFEVCEKLKSNLTTKYIPVIFLTAKSNVEDIIKGFNVGGVDYVSKPFNKEELMARIKTHIEIKVLRGLLPICSSCKKIRDDEGYWHAIDLYMENHLDVIFTHGFCDECLEKFYGKEKWYNKLKNDKPK